MFDLLFAIIGGAIIGWLAKKVARGDIRIPTWLTVACGIAGMYAGTFLYSIFFNPHNNGIEWWRHAWQVVVAAVLVTAVSNYRTHRRVRV